MNHFAIRPLRFVLGLALVLGGGTLAAAPPARAQDIQRIAAVVNDDVISSRDVERRLDLVILQTGQPDTPELRRRLRDRVLRGLIDERLQMQETQRRNIAVSDREMDAEIEQIARINNVDREAFEQQLVRMGVDREAWSTQLKNEIAWRKLIRARLLPTINISEEEIDAAIAHMKSMAGQTEFQVGEIFLSVDGPEQEEEVRRSAQRLVEQLRAGAPFAAVARQFSQGTTAANGGNAGWMQPGMLPEELESALRDMKQGEISDPIRTTAGFYIVTPIARRQILGEPAGDTIVSLNQIMLPFPPTDSRRRAAQLELAQTISASAQNCQDLDRIAKEMKSTESGSLGTMKLRDLPANFQAVIQPLAAGKVSAPIATDKAVHVFAVCSREDPKNDALNPVVVRQGLVGRRIDVLARRYLRDLRRDATVEIR